LANRRQRLESAAGVIQVATCRGFCGGADLGGANLAGADLSTANLAQADFNRANLTEANLSRADLSGANLTQADLRGANLKNVVGLTKEQLASAITD